MCSFSQNYYTGDIATVLGFARTASARARARERGRERGGERGGQQRGNFPEKTGYSRTPATSIKNTNNQQIDVASEIIIHTDVLQRRREEILEEPGNTETRRRSRCYVANILMGGVLTTALIDTGAEVTCISEEFVNKNKERLQECATLPINGVTLNNRNKPSIKIINEEGITSQKKETSIVNSIQREESVTDVKNEEIISKIEESNLTDTETKRQLEHILWKHEAVFRKESGRLKSYQHTLRVKEEQPFIGRSDSIPLAYRERVDEEIKRMLDREIIQRSSSPYINPIVPVIKKDGTVRLCLDARKLNEILLEDWKCPEPAEILFQKCKGIKIMSSLDMTSSFWKIPLKASLKIYGLSTPRKKLRIQHGTFWLKDKHYSASESTGPCFTKNR